MFKSWSISLCLIFISLLQVSRALRVPADSSCAASCRICDKDPYTCNDIASPLNSYRNQNCLPYSSGKQCSKVAAAYEIVDGKGLENWSVSPGAASKNTCKIESARGPFKDLQVFGKMNYLQSASKIISLQTQNMGFVFQTKYFYNLTADFNATPPAPNTSIPDPNDIVNPDGTINVDGPSENNVTGTITETNLTHRSYVDVEIQAGTFTQTLELVYPINQQSLGTLVNTSCGVHFNFVRAISLPAGSNPQQIRLKLTSVAGNLSQWSISKFQVYTGCSGFSFPSGANSLCNTCLSGFYPVYNGDGSLQECGLCDYKCQTCTQMRCISCQPTTVFNSASSKCELTTSYIELNNSQPLIGRVVSSSSSYITSLIGSTDSTVSYKTEFQSVQPYSIYFILIYTRSLITANSSNAVNVYRGETLLQTIPFSELKLQNGFYLGGVSANTRVYTHRVAISSISNTDLNKTLEVRIRLASAQSSQQFWVGNYKVVQFICPQKCSSCSPSGECLECDSFFNLSANKSCVTCPLGFFLKRFWADADPLTPNVRSIMRTQPDLCVKCHSSCLQCLGPDLTDCRACFTYFMIERLIYDNDCITCIYNKYKKPDLVSPDSCGQCLASHSIDFIRQDTDCVGCMEGTVNQLTSGAICEACWIRYSLARGRCIPTADSSLSYYGSDVEQGVVDEPSWTVSSGKLNKLNCTAEYQDLWGVASTNTNESSTPNVTLTWLQKKLPSHQGLLLILNIFKTDIISNTQMTIQVFDEGNNISNVQTINLSIPKDGAFKQVGSNICGGPSNEMIYTYEFDSATHTSTKDLSVKVTAPGGGIYVRQMEVYLGNCNDCAKGQLDYQVQYLPRYRYNDSATGLDVWLQFSREISSSQSSAGLRDAFDFSIDKLKNARLEPMEFKNDLKLNQRLQYFLPIQESFTNGSLNVEKTRDARIFAKVKATSRRLLWRSLLNSRLNTVQSSNLISRYSNVREEDRISMTQLYWFYNFFQWFALITMIVCVMLGIGIILEEFSILLQLLFLHVYISSALLPATLKAPLQGLERMENLNYFADRDIASIERSWFGNYEHPSPYIFQQFNKDIFFERTFYPTIIINLVYLGWFIVLLVIRKVVKPVGESRGMVAQFIRNIPDRPLNYFDQIWRYQFITTMWAAFMQFYILKNDTAKERFNLALCFICFIISLLWPFFVITYTYYITNFKYSSEFLYYYEDIYFRKMVTTSERDFKYYLYIAVRFGRYLIMALFIAVFTYHEIIGPIILIAVNVIQIAYIISMRIWYRSLMGPFLKVLENVLFIFVEIALLFVYGFSDSLADYPFLNLGYAINVLYVIMIIVGIIRIIHHAYLKFKNYREKNSYGKEPGEKAVYKATPLPQIDTNRP